MGLLFMFTLYMLVFLYHPAVRLLLHSLISFRQRNESTFILSTLLLCHVHKFDHCSVIAVFTVTLYLQTNVKRDV